MRLNAIFWLHTRIGGRRAALLGVPLGFAVLVLALATVTFYLSGRRPDERWQFVSTWSSIMAGAEAMFMLLLAPSAIYRAVQRDHTNGMLQSHWITPLSNLRIVLGYLTGPPLMYVLLYLAALVLGAVFTGWLGTLSISGTRLGPLNTLAGWFMGQVPLLLASLLLSSLVLLIALSARTKTNVMALFALVMIFAGWALVLFLPGFAIVSGASGVATLMSFFGMMGPPVPSGPVAQVLGPLMQSVFALLFLAAACRKVRHPERPAFSLALGAAFVVACAATLVVGVDLSISSLRLSGAGFDLVPVQVLASAGAMVFAALVPLLAAGVSAAELDVKKARQPDLPRRHLPLWFWSLTYALGVVAVGWMMCARTPQVAWYEAGGTVPDMVSGAICVGPGLLGFFTTVVGTVYVLRLRSRNVGIGVAIVVIALTIGPLVVAGITSLGLGDAGASYVATMCILGCSPLGALYVAVAAAPMAIVGVAAQLVLAVAALALARRARRDLSRQVGLIPVATPV